MANNFTNTSEQHQLQKQLFKPGSVVPVDDLNEILKHKKESNTVLILGGKLGLQAVEDKIIIQLDRYKSGYECSSCKGEGYLKDAQGEFQCPTCKGVGSSIVIPESAKSLPTSGIIVSAGPLCKLRKEGERVLFGAHVGYFLPFKGSVKIRCMRENEILCLLSSVDAINLGDHIAENEI